MCTTTTYLQDPRSLQAPCFLVGVKLNLLLAKRMKEQLDFGKRRVGVTCFWGIAGVGKSTLVRRIYFGNMISTGGDKENKESWVDVPHPFNLMEFSQRLLLGFYCHWRELQDKEAAAISIMEGQDTIEACCQFFHKYKCTIIIDGLASTHDWDLIEAAFLSKAIRRSSIIAITTSQIVAAHCTSEKSSAQRQGSTCCRCP